MIITYEKIDESGIDLLLNQYDFAEKYGDFVANLAEKAKKEHPDCTDLRVKFSNGIIITVNCRN